ncbi:YL1 nuclear protein C-terminal domain-containing protein [Lentinula guzmanii]|uniref:YL1 nuclear protein C-terminal domain-containing protein n=1 Tax=Lentinula guzmanii TaxID=2804957 RepID=A0AA38J8Y5_9AGAR|nr:YL1 nuclear protein C-terminal domain-containing protein [Lentinula guzmanii]
MKLQVVRQPFTVLVKAKNLTIFLDLSIEAPPSVLPQKHYCDITGLEAPYTDPVTGLRYHDKDVYALIKEMASSISQ